MHYSIRGGPAMDVIDVLAPATPRPRNVTAPASRGCSGTSRLPAWAATSGPVRLALVPQEAPLERAR